VAQELRVSRSKLAKHPKDALADGCKSSAPNHVPPKGVIIKRLGEIRGLSCSTAKKRRLIARLLCLEKTLFTPVNMLKVVRDGKTIFTNPYTGQVYGVSQKCGTHPLRWVNTRATDFAYDQRVINMRIRKIQTLLYHLTVVEISPRQVKTLRRLAVAFNAIPGPQFRKLIDGITLAARSAKSQTGALETLAWRKPNPTCIGGRLPSRHVKLTKGVVRHPRYGDLPVFLPKQRKPAAGRRRGPR